MTDKTSSPEVRLSEKHLDTLKWLTDGAPTLEKVWITDGEKEQLRDILETLTPVVSREKTLVDTKEIEKVRRVIRESLAERFAIAVPRDSYNFTDDQQALTEEADNILTRWLTTVPESPQ